MNYRFRHMVGKPIYGEKPAGLRMNRLMQPATNRTDLELMALAVSAINGCEMCERAHEKTVTDGGLTPDHVNDAVRIAATIYAAAVALEAGVETVSARASSARAQRSGCEGATSCTRRRARSASSMARRAWVSASSGK